MAHAPTSKTLYDPKHENHKAEPARREADRNEDGKNEIAEHAGVPPALSLVPNSEYPLVRDEQVVRSDQAIGSLIAAAEAASKSAKK